MLWFCAVVLLEGFVKAQVTRQIHTSFGTKVLTWTAALIQEKASRLDSTAASRVSSGTAEVSMGLGAAPQGTLDNESALLGNDCLRIFENWK